MHSIIQCGLIPGGKSQERGRDSVFFLSALRKKPNTTWISPELQCTRIFGNITKIQRMYCEEPYTRRICIMDVRIYLIPNDETRCAKFEETRSGNIDFRIQGLPHSTVLKEEYDRREMVRKLIHQFDTHPNRGSLMEDFNKTEEFNQFSEKSMELIGSMSNTEYFELCEISSKIQCQFFLYIGMLAWYTAPAANAFNRQS